MSGKLNKTVDKIVNVAKTSSAVTLTFTGFGVIEFTKTPGIACGIFLSKNVLHDTIFNKNNKFKKDFERAQQTLTSFDKLH